MSLLRNVVVFWMLVFLTLHYVVCDTENLEEEDALARTFQRFPSADIRERPCQHRRQEGVCRRRSECRKPSRSTCRFGLNPIVCCLDKPEPTTTTTTTTRKPSKSTRPSSGNVKEIDLTFPNCGLRSPKLTDDSRGVGASSTSSSNRRRVLSRLGKRDVQPHSRVKRLFDVARPIIVGGVNAKPNSWPWMVALFKTSVPGGPKRFLCGASLISRQYVVTAAHCFDSERGNIDPTKFSIVVGSHTTKDGTEYLVENALIHPGYRPRQYYNDLCLLKIDGLVKLTNKTYPVCLPSDGLRDKIIPGGNDATVTGWGDTSFGGVNSKVLQEVTVPIVPLKDCNASYSEVAKANFPNGITNVFICAGLPEGGKDACQGDSGGPLTTKLKDNSWVQLGVVSFGYGCAQPGYPGVYTRLSQYTKWFYDNTDLGHS